MKNNWNLNFGSIRFSIIIFSTFFLVKLNIVALGGGGYLRLDDLLISFYFFSYILVNLRYLYSPNGMDKYLFYFVAWTLVAIVSALVNSVFTRNVDLLPSLLFALRPLEYFFYIFLGFEAFRRGFRLFGFLRIFLLFLCFLVCLQTVGVVGVVSDFDPGTRAIGNTNGPYELAAISAFLIFYFYYESKGVARVVLCGLAMGLLLGTQSRITLMSVFLIIFSKYIFRVKGLIFASMLIPVVIWIANSDFGVFSRYTEFLRIDFGQLFAWLSGIPDIQDQADYFRLSYDELLGTGALPEGDASAFIRFYRWVLLLKFVFSSFAGTIIGIGPSFASVAVDGFYVRVFVETGFSGIIFFSLFLFYVFKKSKCSLVFRSYFLILLITAFFIDIFVSSKAMFLFWFLFGYYIIGPSRLKVSQERVLSRLRYESSRVFVAG